MKTALRSGLFRKYAAVLLLLIGLTVLIGGGVEMAFNYRDSRSATIALQGAEARAAAGRIDLFLAGLRAQIGDVANLPWSNPEFAGQERRQEYLRLLKIAPAVSEIVHVDASGRELLKVSREEVDRVGGLRSVVTDIDLDRVRASGFAFSPTYFREGSEPYMTLGIAEAGSGAVTLSELNLKFVGDAVARIRVGDSGRVFVLDQANHLVAHPNLSLVLRKPDLSPSALVRLLREPVGSEGVSGVEATSLEGGEVIASSAPVREAGWLVVVEQPREEVMNPVFASLRRTGWLMAFGLVAALLAGYVLARRLSGPIIEVREAAHRIALGDLAARIDVKTGDEVEALADEFNRMAEQLQEYTSGLEKKVEEKTARLQEAMRARELFLAAASHDLRQPLYAISILADALALKDLPGGSKEILGKQRQAIGILRSLFDNLLDLSRFEAGEIRPLLRDVSVREVLNPVAVEYEVMSHAKGLGWHCDLPDAWVRTDPELLRRLVGNLLSNAVRYTNAGSVRLDAAASDTTVTFTIADTGIGIPPEHQARVFEEFVQLDNPSRERERGVGLGLSIVRKIDALLDTRLKLRSAPGEGTRVSFELPIAAVRAEPVAPAEPATIAASNLPGARIWVVEDDVMVRNALSAQLDSWAVDHDFATTREEILALREADGEWPDAIILDDMLGQASEGGLELARWLNEHMSTSRITLVTGNVEPARVRALQDSGFRVLRKPISSAVLAQALGESVESAKESRAVAPGE